MDKISIKSKNGSSELLIFKGDNYSAINYESMLLADYYELGKGHYNNSIKQGKQNWEHEVNRYQKYNNICNNAQLVSQGSNDWAYQIINAKEYSSPYYRLGVLLSVIPHLPDSINPNGKDKKDRK